MSNVNGTQKSHHNNEPQASATAVKNSSAVLTHMQMVNDSDQNVWVWVFDKPADEVTIGISQTDPYAIWFMANNSYESINTKLECVDGLSYAVSDSNSSVSMASGIGEALHLQMLYR